MALLVVIAFLWNIPEYSIFQKMENFACCSIFLEYSKNIPYSRKLKIIMLSNFSGILHFVKFHIPWDNPGHRIFHSFLSLFNGGVNFHQALNRVVRQRATFTALLSLNKSVSNQIEIHFSSINKFLLQINIQI